MIRSATPADISNILVLIHDLAEYERARQEVQATPATLHDALFGEHPSVFCDVAEVDGEIVGFALWFLSFSTWLGQHGIYLEDLYVHPSQRGAGIGRALLVRLAQRCVEQGYGRLEWSVLDWNAPALGFYRALGAEPMDEWTVHRLSGPELAHLGRSA